MAIVKVEKNSYTVESLYQWDLNQVLEIRGLSMAAVPEVHFTNDAMARAIRRFATMDASGVIRAEVPNALLQTAAKIRALVCIREGEVFKTYHEIRIPVKARPQPADYTITDDQDIYSFMELENLVYESAVKTAADAEAAAASAAQAVAAAEAAQQTAEEAKNTAAGIAAVAEEAKTTAEEAKTAAADAEAEAKGYTDSQVKKARPVNLLDNSDFTDPVNRTGFTGGVPGADNVLIIDKWKTQQNTTKNIEINFDASGLIIHVSTGLAGIAQKIQKPKVGVTFAAKVNGKIESIYSVHGVDVSTKTAENVLLYVEWLDEELQVIIRNTGDEANTYTIEWAALYEGEYTAETLPAYQPRGYSLEAAACGGAGPSMELLWENASPDSDFAAQTISVNGEKHTHFIIDFNVLAGSTNGFSSVVFPGKTNLCVNAATYQGKAGGYIHRRDVTISADKKSFSFSNGYRQLGETEEVNKANIAVPMAIYGF